MAEPLGNNSISFIWKGKDRQGKIQTGELFTANEATAKAELRHLGICILNVKKKPKPLFTKATKPIITKDIAIFARQLATLLKVGVPIVQSIDIIGKGHENPSMAELLLTVKIDIEGGDTLAQALKKHPLYFDELFCSFVNAGEQAGVLETLLDKIATYKEKSESMKAKVKKSLTYPISVIVIAFIVTAILLIFVVPIFKDLFDSFGANLPSFTLWIMQLSDQMIAYWYYIFGSLITLVYTFRYFKKHSKKFNYFLERLMLKIPIVGLILHKSAITRFARTLSTMSASGVPLVEALQSVAGATGNIVYYHAVMQIREEIATGQRLQYAMLQTHLFPHMVIQMLAIGEESGLIDKMLDKVADFYDEEVDNLVDNLSSLMEPFIMCILGILVGGLIVAMYLPIFKLGAAVG
jgi:type IV pilus assembly protein PilC